MSDSSFSPPDIFRGQPNSGVMTSTAETQEQTLPELQVPDTQEASEGESTPRRPSTPLIDQAQQMTMPEGAEYQTIDDSDDSDDDLFQSLPPSRGEPVTPYDGGALPMSGSTPYMDAGSEVPKATSDLAKSVKGMYRVLDLINEEGSGGLVDKIIIAQDTLQEFINALSPGAYASITKVDFKTLDQLAIKPIGVYGSKEEIVQFLVAIHAVDDQTAQALMDTQGKGKHPGGFNPTLRSGLYIVRANIPASVDEQIYVLYWPEDTTWDDSAVSSVSRNRVTFMRYLTKMCDQVVCLISSEHSRSLVWNDTGAGNPGFDVDIEAADRMFTFEVAKTKEQEENVIVRSGFEISENVVVHESSNTPVESTLSPPPRLLLGETVQGVLNVTYLPHGTSTALVTREHINGLKVRALKEQRLILSDNLEEDIVYGTFLQGVDLPFRKQCEDWKASERDIRDRFRMKREGAATDIRTKVERDIEQLRQDLAEVLIGEVLLTFSTIRRDDLNKYIVRALKETLGPSDETSWKQRIQHLILLYPDIQSEIESVIQDTTKDKIIKSKHFKTAKFNLTLTQIVLHKRKDLDESLRQTLIDWIFRKQDLGNALKILSNFTSTEDSGWFFASYVQNKWTGRKSKASQTADSLNEETEVLVQGMSDADFLSTLNTIEHELRTIAAEVDELAHDRLANIIISKVKKLSHKLQEIQIKECTQQSNREVDSEESNELRILKSAFFRSIEGRANPSSRTHVYIDRLESSRSYGIHAADSYHFDGRRESMGEPEMLCRIQYISLPREQSERMRMDPTFTPSPAINPSNSCSFRLSVGLDIRHAQLLQDERLLLILVDDHDRIAIYLQTKHTMERAIRENHITKCLPHVHEKLGTDFMFAFDESKRMLAIYGPSKLQLHIFVFDETFAALHAQGSTINLTAWYNPGSRITHACFICGSEEILLVDSSAQARVFSLIMQQFRPATIKLEQPPDAVYSSPDGSCLLLQSTKGSQKYLTAYHWLTFGSSEGIPLGSIDFPADSMVLSSLGDRNIVHLIGLDISNRHCQSIALDITRKITEFTFKEMGGARSYIGAPGKTVHNSLLDCHIEVWKRFPVLPAVSRRTITSSSVRRQKRLTFIADDPDRPFALYISEMIISFERTTRKPTGQELSAMDIYAADFRALLTDTLANPDWDVSRFRAGEWLVDLLCLIPIHIAVCRENRFIPLKDGIFSAELEKNLLGAEVNEIVDSLSFGWYESIFQSYMASKPVKVVSSMGEQSVGKSFTLNHLADTSFAGSAMRTTEGVWMSVTPTDEDMIVALDFEGVHSLERSAQEDTLLVLFNTAISNLILFRNNFAISREITGLFQSFQSSSAVLDPAANPSLFQSTLIIIIKDVVDSDKIDVVREFSLKFHKIVQDEQDANFISRLHAGNLRIIPWPVIESKEFYIYFPALKKRLDQQTTTHHAAGEFLHTLKTLMAKLKANDWGALSQTMAGHRAKSLSTILPTALETGFSEVEPNYEELRNLDTDTVIDRSDTPAHFFLAGFSVDASDREQRLSALLHNWDQFSSRQHISDVQWIRELSAHLSHLVDLRADHVREWLNSNLSRFQASHTGIEELRRTFDSAIIDLRSSVQLCGAQCTQCHLLCVQSRLHEGGHDCRTTHTCVCFCDFCDEERPGGKSCGMRAGHPGQHICAVGTHLCGAPCQLVGKQGCMDECTKIAGHAEDHMCSAKVHMCGAPCSLKNITLADGRLFSCSHTCCKPSHEDHTEHTCDNRLCTISCQLCKRLCTRSHLHGLIADEPHLCGETHSCTALCAAGTCQIDTAPQSIEATFTGRHETYQYTKYTQVARRLPCVRTIQPGDLEHDGAHIHSTEERPFHFCVTRCGGCGYFCTLPLDHPQQEHETRHGSMSNTRWAVDGPDGTSLELGGRKYASSDEGAPMMCSLVCSSMGRHVHVDYCRADDVADCGSNEIQHITNRMTPNPDRPKDWLTHSLYWQRMGFKDPYPRDDQANFAKCDAMCSGPEHITANPAIPSYCTQPLFHAPADPATQANEVGYVSHDGHTFTCKNPVELQQAFHVMFVIDKSGSMTLNDRRPLPDDPATERIRRNADNRLGAVFSALYRFWSARHAAVNVGQHGIDVRRDSYSIMFFNSRASMALTNNVNLSPDELLSVVLGHRAQGNTNFSIALQSVQDVMENNWTDERTPVIIFLSDGECRVADGVVEQLCGTAVRLGKPLSLHAVSFGQDSQSSSLRRMARVALDAQNAAPRDALLPAAATVLSSYSEAPARHRFVSRRHS